MTANATPRKKDEVVADVRKHGGQSRRSKKRHCLPDGPASPELTGGGAVREIVTRGELISARLDFSEVKVTALRDSLGKALFDPPERTALPLVCRACPELAHDQTVEIVASPAYAWRKLGLVEPDGRPTRRGVVFGFFQGGEGLAIAAALEEATYPIDDLVFDLANVRAGPRFAGEDAPLGGRLGRSASRCMNGPIIRDTSRWGSR